MCCNQTSKLAWEREGGPDKDLEIRRGTKQRLLAAGVLGDGLGALTDSVLGKLTRQQETNSSLDLATGDGGTLVVVGQSGSFSGDSLKDIVDKAVHDRHGLAADASVRVHLFQHLVDVDSVAFLPLPLAFLVAGADSFGLAGLLGAFSASLGLGRHVFDSEKRMYTEQIFSSLYTPGPPSC